MLKLKIKVEQELSRVEDVSERAASWGCVQGCVSDVSLKALPKIRISASHQRKRPDPEKNTRQVRIYSVLSRELEKKWAGQSPKSSMYKLIQIIIDFLRVITRWTALADYGPSELWAMTGKFWCKMTNQSKIMGYGKLCTGYGLREVMG